MLLPNLILYKEDRNILLYHSNRVVDYGNKFEVKKKKKTKQNDHIINNIYKRLWFYTAPVY